jgi:hypothetical protein
MRPPPADRTRRVDMARRTAPDDLAITRVSPRRDTYPVIRVTQFAGAS